MKTSFGEGERVSSLQLMEVGVTQTSPIRTRVSEAVKGLGAAQLSVLMMPPGGNSKHINFYAHKMEDIKH